MSYDLWTSLISNARTYSSFPSISECLVDLLKQVPAFRTDHVESFLIHDKLVTCVQYLLEWTTTTDLTCERPKKWTSHYLVLGVQKPVTYEFLRASEPCPDWPGIKPDRAEYLSSLIFPWAYILCSRWVETLQDFRKKVTMRQSKNINIPHIIIPRKIGPSQNHQDDCYKKLFHCINSCITLSCAEERIRSLLCSLFFEPTVPCNLVGAQLSGVKSATQSINNNSRIAALLMAKRSRKIYPLWETAIWVDGTIKIFAYTIKGMPPINIPGASWRGTLQSFIQAKYHSTTSRTGFVPRA